MTDLVRVGDILPNLGLAPRGRTCWICKHVTMPEHVTALCFTAQGNRKPPKEAVDYLYSIGLSGSYNNMANRVRSHQTHIGQYAADPHPIAPFQQENGSVTKVTIENTHWVDANQQAIDVGTEAMRLLASRLPELDDKNLIAAAKLGLTASSSRGQLEAKGRTGTQMDVILKALAGTKGDE